MKDLDIIGAAKLLFFFELAKILKPQCRALASAGFINIVNNVKSVSAVLFLQVEKVAAHQRSVGFTQVHSASAAVSEGFAVGARFEFAHPCAVAVWFETVVPYCHKIIAVYIALGVIGTDARTCRDISVYQNRAYRYAGVAAEKAVAYIALVLAEKALAAV